MGVIRNSKFAALAGALAAIAVVAVVWTYRSASTAPTTGAATAGTVSAMATTSTSTSTSASPRRTAAVPPAIVEAAAKHDPLAVSLASDDVAQQLRLIEGAVREGKVDALATLTALRLADEPEIAPTVIHAVASLAAQAGEKEHGQAVHSLAGWLKTELRRDGTDAAGNVPNLIESLGDLGGREAVDSLIEALGSERSDLAVDTLIVQRLGALGDARAKDAIVRFAKQIPQPAAEATDFDRELHAEAVAAADEALKRL